MRHPLQTRSLLAIVAVLAAAACASAAPHSTPDTTPEVLIDQNGRVFRTTDSPTEMSFPASADSTFRALSDAYAALGIDPSTIDPAARVVGRQHMTLHSNFQGKPLSSAFDCGSGQFGPRADQGRITADITSRVIARGASSGVTTTVEASLVPNDGASRDPIRCVSHGGIEESIRREVSMRLGVPYQKP